MSADILAEILAHKRTEVEQARQARPAEQLSAAPLYAAKRRDFYGAVTQAGARPNLIAEIKRRSPSAGEIRPDLDSVEIARLYAEAGAAALSILTDARYFGGGPELIAAVRSAVALPILRKEFIIDEYQISESRALGADAILLIAEALAPETIVRFALRAAELELAVLIEAHSSATLRPMLAALDATAGAPRVLIGINNRDLARQMTDLATFEELAPEAGGRPLVAESGIHTATDVQRMQAAGAVALLIGESLLRAPDPGEKIRELLT